MALPSDEIAEAYKDALEDLITNDRSQIANLTMIAKENIEHAEAISRVLTNHIKRASPTRKLPALYVLDSLVKNIGSPYTIYFGRDLHSTFMFAYSQVDGNVRRKLEELLKTWREPVPGSLSTTSVFPQSSTQGIIDSLSKYRASTTPMVHRYAQPPPGVRPQMQTAYRNTPTPPPVQVPTPIPYGQSQYSMPAQSQASAYVPPTTTPYQDTNTKSTHQQAFPQASMELAKLNADIDDLTTDAKIECATHPMDSGAQRRLVTLQTLKEILDGGAASDQDLDDIRKTIASEMAKKHVPPHQPPDPVHTIAQQLPYQVPQIQPSYAPLQSNAAPTLPLPPSFINSTNLADLLRATSRAQTTPQSQPSFPTPSPYQPPPILYNGQPAMSSASGPPPVSSSIPQSALPLLEQLRASGLLSATPTPPQGITPPTGLGSYLAAPQTADIAFTSASIKIPRPHMWTLFLNERPNQCSTCGKRFTSDDNGREKKARHLDWHFKTKARLIDAERRGLHRSWYVDEREWIANKELDDDLGDNDAAVNPNGASPSAAKKKQDFVRVPTDPALRSAPCPIDQEPFTSEWSEEVQDFIWKDAIKVGNRYYHASCYREVTRTKERETTPVPASSGRIATPDSVLGKRKAENAEPQVKSRIKVEG